MREAFQILAIPYRIMDGALFIACFIVPISTNGNL